MKATFDRVKLMSAFEKMGPFSQSDDLLVKQGEMNQIIIATHNDKAGIVAVHTLDAEFGDDFDAFVVSFKRVRALVDNTYDSDVKVSVKARATWTCARNRTSLPFKTEGFFPKLFEPKTAAAVVNRNSFGKLMLPAGIVDPKTESGINHKAVLLSFEDGLVRSMAFSDAVAGTAWVEGSATQPVYAVGDFLLYAETLQSFNAKALGQVIELFINDNKLFLRAENFYVYATQLVCENYQKEGIAKMLNESGPERYTMLTWQFKNAIKALSAVGGFKIFIKALKDNGDGANEFVMSSRTDSGTSVFRVLVRDVKEDSLFGVNPKFGGKIVNVLYGIESTETADLEVMIVRSAINHDHYRVHFSAPGQPFQFALGGVTLDDYKEEDSE